MTLLYAKVVNEETKQCEVGLGDPAEMFDENMTVGQFYESLGMTLQEVEQDYSRFWYLAGYVPEQSIDKLKITKREEINQARDEAEQGGFEYMGKIFDSDPVSCQRISCAAQAMSMVTMSEEVPTITWTCQDNTTIDLNPQELMGLVVALAQHSNTCHQKATALKEKIEPCTSKEELDKIVWE